MNSLGIVPLLSETMPKLPPEIKWTIFQSISFSFNIPVIFSDNLTLPI
jgi:hypothetical protein